jgi:hypothetical protein
LDAEGSSSVWSQPFFGRTRYTAASAHAVSALHRPSSLRVAAESVLLLGYAAFFLGTLAPFFRASESPIAIACLRLFTLPPLPP